MVDVVLAHEDMITKNLMKIKCSSNCDATNARKISAGGKVRTAYGGRGRGRGRNSAASKNRKMRRQSRRNNRNTRKK